nr:hypothetical protein [Tanacetum cinerariifolium]
MNEDCYHEQNSCYNSNSFGFDQFLPQQLPVIDQTPLEETKAQYWKIPIFYDDDEDYNIAITPKEPDNSLNEFIKSSVENLVPNPSDSEGEYECDVPACDDFTTFSNILFDANDDFSSSNDESFYYENILKKIYSNLLFDEEIISIKIDLHHFNDESDLIESLLNQDSLIISSSSKIDSLLDEFAGELTLLKSIPLGINETNCDPDNSFMEEIKLSFTLDDPMPPGIEEDDYDSERDILILKELPSNDSLSLLVKMSHFILIFLYPSSSCKTTGWNTPILDVPFLHFYLP